MPTLDFKGKSFVYTHHLGVPFRELIVSPDKSCPLPGAKPGFDDNLILKGDNLEGLKALLPRYAGKVDCIFIDPPYNTGNEGWCYNDKVNSPLMKEWLKTSGNPVDKEDLQRHDKWLSMMWPRLQLLKELLAEDGVLVATLDDNEQHHFRMIADEIFGEENGFYAHVAWQKKYATSNDAKGFSAMFDHVLFYRKSPEFSRNLLERTEANDANYRHEDENGVFRIDNYTCNKTAEERPNLYYPITNPNTGEEILPRRTAVWRYSRETHQANVENNLVWWGVDGNGRVPAFKRYRHLLRGGGGTVPSTWWPHEFAGHTDEAKKELHNILPDLPEDLITITPKPVRLIQRILEVATDPDSIVLDSFAGSGTTAHATLLLNKKDGGNRRFILCEMEDYADALTAERVRRVINGYEFEGTLETELLSPPEKVTWTTFEKDSKRQTILDRIEGIENLERANYDSIEKKITDGLLTVVGKKRVTERVEGLGGSFTFVELGESMDLERLLAETPGKLPSFASLARYLFYTVTGQTLPEDAVVAKGKAKKPKAEDEEEMPVLIGETDNLRIYLNYKEYEDWLRSPPASLTRKQAEALSKRRDEEAPSKKVLVVAPSKYISHKALQELRVEFAQLPYTIHRIAD
jgi:adenine-specific DNA-methyltransferase